MNDIKRKLQIKFHRDLIVDTAEKMFQSFGLEKTIMDQIAKEAGYSKATIYAYFKSKEEIFNFIILRGMNILKKYFEEAVNSDKAIEDKCYDLCFAFSNFQEKYPLHFEGILGNINIDFNECDENDIIYQIYLSGEALNLIAGKLIEEGVKTGALRKDLKVKEAVFMLWASVSGIVRIAAQKEIYIEKYITISKYEFMRYSFSLLINSLKER